MAFDLALFVERRPPGWSPSHAKCPCIVLLAQEDPEFPLDENRHSHHAHLAFYRGSPIPSERVDSFSLSPRRRGSPEVVSRCVRVRSPLGVSQCTRAHVLLAHAPGMPSTPSFTASYPSFLYTAGCCRCRCDCCLAWPGLAWPSVAWPLASLRLRLALLPPSFSFSYSVPFPPRDVPRDATAATATAPRHATPRHGTARRAASSRATDEECNWDSGYPSRITQKPCY